MSIESLVGESARLVELLDPIVEDIADIRLQGIADSAWHRLSVVNGVSSRCGRWRPGCDLGSRSR